MKGGLAIPGGQYEVWDAPVAGSRITDLLDAGGGVISSPWYVSADANGMIKFSVTTVDWSDPVYIIAVGAPGFYGRVRLDPSDMAARLAALESASIGGALLQLNNLSDLTSQSAARGNLGLGDSATRNVGTGAGTVAAGDDSRLEPRYDVLLIDAFQPTGRYETRSRLNSGNVGSGVVSGTLYLIPVWLPSGLVVNSITFATGSTAATTPTNQWFGLYNSSRVLLALTTNGTTGAWAANTAKTLNIATIASGASSTFTTTYEGLHYFSLMVTATGMPTMFGGGTVPAPVANDAPSFGAANTGMTTPPAFPFTANTPTGTGLLAYAYAN